MRDRRWVFRAGAQDGSGGAAAGGNAGVEDSGFDLALALEHVEGDGAILRHMAHLYLKQSGRLHEDMRRAIDDGDSDALARHAHKLKGSMSMFGARAACEAARRLEETAQAGSLADAEINYAALLRASSALETAIVAFAAGQTP